MFKSIGLNIDHPETFFVQQGRITQIVSFKPLEILDMLMESAGVALFHEIADNTKVVLKDKTDKLEITQQRMKLNFGPRIKLMDKERAKLAEHQSLKAEMDNRKLLEGKIKKYLAQRTLKFGSDTLTQCENNLSENQKLVEFYKTQMDNLKKMNTTETGGTKELTEELKKIDEMVQSMQLAVKNTKLEREEKIREKKNKSEALQTLREKKAEKEKAVTRAQTLKENMDGLFARLKDRLDNLAEEKHQMGVKADSGIGSDDPAKPIMNRIAKLKQEMLQRKDDLERTKKQINQAHEHLKNSEKSKLKLEHDLEDARAEEKSLMEEEKKLKDIVGLILARKKISIN
jgi:structural maintenance of chromosome 2